MPAKRTNYSKMHENARPETMDESTMPIETPEKTMVKAMKKGTVPIRIRKGPSLEHEHTGEYLKKAGVVEFDDVKNGWGHLPGKGWVCLDYVELI